MFNRVIVLILLLLLRIVIGLFFIYKISIVERISASVKVVKVNHNNTKCNIDFDSIVVKQDLECKYKVGDVLSVFGRPRFVLIEALKGKLVMEMVTFNTNVLLGNPEGGQNQTRSPFLVIKNYCRNIYRRYLPKSESALLAGIVLGDKEDIGYDFYQKMVSSGSIHIAVASGFNLMLVGTASLNFLFWFLVRKKATAVAIAIMIFYAILAGSGAPVLRAVIMTSIVYISLVVGRKVDVWWSLFLSAWFMLVWDFGYLWDVSFQLSMAASVGLMVFAPKIEDWLINRGWEVEVVFLEKLSVVSTVAVMALTTPIIWYHFGRVNLIGLFSNVFILPLVPPVMILGSLMLVWPQVFFVPTYALVHLIVRLIYFFGS